MVTNVLGKGTQSVLRCEGGPKGRRAKPGHIHPNIAEMTQS